MDAGQRFERVGRLIYGFHRWASPEALRALPGDATVPAGLAARGAGLARQYDELLAMLAAQEGAGAQERIEALLLEAQAFSAELASARG